MGKYKKSVLSVCLGTIMVLLMVGCANENIASSSSSDIELVKTYMKSEHVLELSTPTDVFPLTGISYSEEDDQSSKRAFSVMIENSAQARPQSGLFQADLVYEVLSEGRITRQLAFFHSQEPETIGPVRSARDYFIYLNDGIDSILASAGGSPDAIALMDEGYFDVIRALNYDGRFFSRATFRNAPHNMYTSYSQLEEAAEHIGYSMTDPAPPALLFSDDENSSAEQVAASTVTINYGSSGNNVLFSYDEASKGYVRSVGGNRVDDRETGAPVAPRNILIISTKHDVIDKQGRRDIDLQSGGEAYLVKDGFAEKLQWKNVNGLILPYRNDELVPFSKGQTWINIVELGLDEYIDFP